MKTNIPDSIQKLIWYGEVKSGQDDKQIITAVLNRGGFDEIKWLFKNYQKEEITDSITSPLKGQWDKKSLNLWSSFFKIEIGPAQFQFIVSDVRNF